MDEVTLGTLTAGRIALGTRLLRGEADARALLHAAGEAGINLVDTAPGYGGGVAEAALGAALMGRRERFLVATKIRPPAGRGAFRPLTGGEVVHQLEASLGALKTDYVDLLQIHHADPAADYGEIAGVLDDLKGAGKIREYGISNFDSRELGRWPGHSSPVLAQLPYNLIQRGAVEGVRGALDARGIGIAAYSPLLGGVLTDRGLGGEVDDPGAGWIRGLLGDDSDPLLDALRQGSQTTGLPVGTIALAWVLCAPGVAVVLVGTRDPGHLSAAARAPEALAGIGPLIRELGRHRPSEPVIPLDGSVGEVLRRCRSGALAEIILDLRGQEMRVARWLPPNVRRGSRVVWDGLGDRLVKVYDEGGAGPTSARRRERKRPGQ